MGLAVTVESETQNGSDKQPGAYRTISEVAEGLDIPQHVLRFWESRFAQIKPMKRGGGRRYYRPDDVDLLRGIKRLLHGQGYTIRGAQRILKENGVRFVQAVGRGEAEVGAPSVHERDPETIAGPGGDALALSATDRAALEAALNDLRDCRAILTQFGPDGLDAS